MSLVQVVKVVEYLETSMSKDLLCKFPDNSAFDFDYTESSLWSPLLPPPVKSLSDDYDSLQLSTKLSFQDETSFLENTKKIAATIKRKFTNNKNVMMMMKKRNCFGLSSVHSSYRLNSPSEKSTPKKAWGNVMKAASKHFKKKKNKKKDYSNVHLDLSNYI